ncbi:MAG: hypothetical protein SFX73_19270 [Kofleriaceae bacterium]|nr:hypothetical protein [Kofleriaceae bacterium]
MKFAACVVAMLGCANNVPQDRSTGPDGKQKGAKAIVLAQNEGKAGGVVTYPGGDRIDWRVIQLPEGERGQLDLTMTYTTPRPGLRVSFDIFDQWNMPVTPASTSGGRSRTRSATVKKAAGKYYVRIYAPRRGDAGTYKLTAAFVPDEKPPIFNPLDIEVSAPPKLPAVPDAPVACTTHDPANPECEQTCAPGAPTTWKGCPQASSVVVTPPTPPTPPPVVANPITARLVKKDTVGGAIEITLLVGKSSGIDKSWKAQVLRGETTTALPGGAGQIVSVDRAKTIVRVSLTPDQLTANPNVLLSP